MKRTFLSIAFLVTSGAYAATLYDNTSIDTLDTLFFSVGPYTGIGDQIHLRIDESIAQTATLQFYNLGRSGTFDAELRFYNVGTPVGTQLGPEQGRPGTYTITDIPSLGLDIIDVTFNIRRLRLPQDVISVASVSNATSGLDLGLNLFEPPTVGFSDNTFLIVDNGDFSRGSSIDANVYFQLIGQSQHVPEPSTTSLFGLGIVAASIWRMCYARVQ